MKICNQRRTTVTLLIFNLVLEKLVMNTVSSGSGLASKAN